MRAEVFGRMKMADHNQISQDYGENTADIVDSSTVYGRFLVVVGTLGAALPHVLDTINLLPDSMKNSKYVALSATLIGGLMSILGVVKETIIKLEVLHGHAAIHAAAAGKDAA